MKVSKKALSAAVLAAGLVFTGISAANAGTSSEGFTAEMPHLQQAWNSASQTKTTAKASGSVSISSVGSSYTANARMCQSSNHNNCGDEVKGIGGGGGAALKNGFNAKNTVVLQLHENPWAAVAVTAKGSWKSN